jgi:hypothetical protein
MIADNWYETLLKDIYEINAETVQRINERVKRDIDKFKDSNFTIKDLFRDLLELGVVIYPRSNKDFN